MIVGDGIVLGAGGATASIFVTGLSETDSVSVTHKIPGKVLNPEWKVPDGYTQLEYIESTGTQYIVTGLNSTTRYDHEITFSDYAYVKGQGILGSNTWYYSYTGYNNTLRWCMSDRCYDTPGSVTSKRTAKLGYNYLTVDGSSVSQTSDTNGTPSDTTHTLFKGYNCASVKIYSYRASLDGQLLRDFVPCKRNSDDELGMYDLVNDVFYPNAGTGAFTAGAEVPQYVDGYVDGKIYKGKWFSEQKQIRVDKEIPKMTSNTTPSGVASSTSDYDSNYVAWKAFDKNDVGTAGWSPPYNASLSSTYCQYEFTEPIVPTKIQIGFGGDGYTFTVKASLDGTSWDILASNISNSSGSWSTVDITTDKYYKYFRFYMVGASNGTGKGAGHKFNVIGYAEEEATVSGFEFIVNQYGTYTITATDGTKTATQDVLVDSAIEYSVEVDYKLWLYKDGDECIDVTGGWIRITSGYSYSNASFAPNGTYNQFIKRSDRMSLTSYYIYSTLISTSKAIDFTGYTTVHVEYELEGPSLIISTPERSDLANPLYPLSFSEDGSADISIPGEAYPFFLSYSGHPVDVKKVWLE